MAINLTTNPSFTGRHQAADASYPYGSAQDETAPGANDGSPVLKVRSDDIFGLQQALLAAAGIVPSGNADTGIASQYLEALVELMSGRAYNYDDAGVADAYVLALKTNQQGPQSLFDGLIAVFTVANTNTGASTANVNGLGVKNITDEAGVALTAGLLAAGAVAEIRYNLSSDRWELLSIASGPGVATARVNFDGTGVVAINDAFNVSSVTDNGVGDYTANFAVAFANADYTFFGTCRDDDDAGAAAICGPFLSDAKTTAGLQIHTTGTTAVIDSPEVNVVIFGGN